MVKPLLDYFGADKILSVSMATIHGVPVRRKSLIVCRLQAQPI